MGVSSHTPAMIMLWSRSMDEDIFFALDDFPASDE
jgi:hypothetical protein